MVAPERIQLCGFGSALRSLAFAKSNPLGRTICKTPADASDPAPRRAAVAREPTPDGGPKGKLVQGASILVAGWRRYAPRLVAGADVVMNERVASHTDALWREEFPLMVAWASGR